MAKRGRARTNGRKPGWMLGRALIAIEAYDRARRDGQKHWFALEIAVNAVRAEFSGVPISQSEVKRVLAELRPKNAPEALLVIKNNGIWTFGFGKRPDYRRRHRRGPPSSAASVFMPIGQIYLD
jgi:hypothetical protein